MRDVFVSWARDALDLLFPLECLACGRGGALCCGACLASVRPSERGRRLVVEASSVETVAAYAYAAPLVRSLLTGWKYEGWTSAEPSIEALARRWAATRSAWVGDAVLVPVPLHAGRERTRGFNQAERLARWVADATGARLMPGALRRVRATAPQARASDKERAPNVEGAFAAALPRVQRERAVVLIDDVLTSGATLAACAQALRAAGSGPIRAFALAWGTGGRLDDDGSAC